MGGVEASQFLFMRIHPVSLAQAFYKEDSSHPTPPCNDTSGTSINDDRVAVVQSFPHPNHGEKEMYSCEEGVS